MYIPFPTSIEFVFWLLAVGVVLRAGARLFDYFLLQLKVFLRRHRR